MAKLYFRYGAMNCGKSTHLIQVAYNYQERGMKTLILKPAIDTKGNDEVVSRLGSSRKADFLITKDDKILDLSFEGISCVLVDEVQFLTVRQIDELLEISKLLDIPVICYGLRTDFLMNGFEASQRLLAIADDIEEMKTICRCGKKATFNMRLKNAKPIFEGDQVAIDGANEAITYESVCGSCYLKRKKGISNY